MRKIILLSLCTFLCNSGFAQNIKIEGSEIKENNNSVFVTLTIVADKLKSNERLTLTPVLYSGDKSQTLTPIIIAGRNRQIADKRNAGLQARKTARNQHITYSISHPYEHWMSDISLRIDRKIESCCTERLLPPQAVIKEKPIRYDVILPKIELIQDELSTLKKLDAETSFLAPMAEYNIMKENFDVMRTEEALIVRFKQGGSVIDSSFKDNAKSLDQLCEVLNVIAKCPAASIGKIVLAGAASPEGPMKLNDHLAKKRAEGLQDFLNSKITLDISQIESVNIGEDWTGLRKIIEQSDMRYKKEVLDIINNVPVMKGREKQLMDLKWGRPYNYMLEHFFSELRSAGYVRVFYVSKPNVGIVKTNEAIGLYNNKEYQEALARLEGVKPTAITEHLRGVCHMMLGELDKAELNLNGALELGNKEAVNSLKQLNKLKLVQQ